MTDEVAVPKEMVQATVQPVGDDGAVTGAVKFKEFVEVCRRWHQEMIAKAILTAPTVEPGERLE